MPDSNLAISFAAQIRKEILEGTLPGGTQLKQDYLAKSYNSSHVPIREALMILVAEGLAERKPRCGVIVKNINVDDIKEVVEMRAVLEPLALKLSCSNLTKEALQQAQNYLTLEKSEKNIDNLLQYNWQFHRTLYSGTNKPKLMSTIEELWIHSERYMRFVWSKLNYHSTSHKEHQQIFRACRDKNYACANKILREHISQAGSQAESLLHQY